MSTTLRPRGILKETRYGAGGGRRHASVHPPGPSPRTLDSLLDGPAPSPPMEQIQILYGGVVPEAGDAAPGGPPGAPAATIVAAGLPPPHCGDAASACSSLEDSLEGRGVVAPITSPGKAAAPHATPPPVPAGGPGGDLHSDPAAGLDGTLGTASSVRPEERAELVDRVACVLAGIHGGAGRDLYDEDDEDEDSLDGETRPCVEKEYTIINFPNGDLFSGNVDRETGELVYGRMTCPIEMETYEGPFRGGTRHGDGATCSKMDGSAKFLGRYHKGQMRSGTLVVAGESGYTYTGTFRNGEFHGSGTIASRDGSIYQGQFEKGAYHGVGVLRTASAGGESVYAGEFSDGVFHGIGSISNGDGTYFAGRWSAGSRAGGTERLPNGDVFEGSYDADGERDRGTLRKRDCRVVSAKDGAWRGETLLEGSDMRIVYRNGHVYCGDHSNSLPHGFGRMEYANLNGSGAVTYTGWFVNGCRSGEGRCFFHRTGEEYEGEFVCDEPSDLALFRHGGPFEEVCGALPPPSTSPGPRTEDGADAPGGDGAPDGAPGHDGADGGGSPSSSPTITPPKEGGRGSDETLNNSLMSAITTARSSGNLSDANNSGAKAARRNSGRGRVGSNNFSLTSLNIDVKSLDVYDYNTEDPRLYRYANGDVFNGRLDANGLRQGSGTYTEHKTGSVYNGDWKDSKRHGVGHLKLSSGLVYSGEFHEDSIRGEGSLTLINGSLYNGSFVNGVFHGNGTLEDEEHNRVYFGEFKNGERSGKGREHYSNNYSYVGDYRDGKRNGHGVFSDQDGSEVYSGEYEDDLMHGRGRLSMCTRHGGGNYEGDFFHDKFSGSGTYTYPDGTSVEGQWLDDVPQDGDWTIRYPDGAVFYGFATFRNPDGDADETSDALSRTSSRSRSSSRTSAEDALAVLAVPLPHGFGSMTFPNGRRQVGSFIHGRYVDDINSNT